MPRHVSSSTYMHLLRAKEAPIELPIIMILWPFRVGQRPRIHSWHRPRQSPLRKHSPPAIEAYGPPRSVTVLGYPTLLIGPRHAVRTVKRWEKQKGIVPESSSCNAWPKGPAPRVISRNHGWIVEYSLHRPICIYHLHTPKLEP